MSITRITILQKKELERELGKDLIKKHGKKKFYSSDHVLNSIENLSYSPDYIGWAMSFFTDHKTFDNYCSSTGVKGDYIGMKKQMTSAITDGASESWVDFDFDASWIDLPNFDFSDFFGDFFDIF